MRETAWLTTGEARWPVNRGPVPHSPSFSFVFSPLKFGLFGLGVWWGAGIFGRTAVSRGLSPGVGLGLHFDLETGRGWGRRSASAFSGSILVGGTKRFHGGWAYVIEKKGSIFVWGT